jgi:hypothetical protein
MIRLDPEPLELRLQGLPRHAEYCGRPVLARQSSGGLSQCVSMIGFSCAERSDANVFSRLGDFDLSPASQLASTDNVSPSHRISPRSNRDSHGHNLGQLEVPNAAVGMPA